MLKAAIFDDEYIVLQGLKQMVDWQYYGIELIGTAEDGLSALELVRAKQPDIIFTDIRMPGLDGLQLIEAIMNEQPDTLCIVFSGFNEFEYVRRAIGLGVIDYLEKPITIDSMQETIQKTLDRIAREQQFGAMKTQYEASRAELVEKAALDLLFQGDARAAEKLCREMGIERASIGSVMVLAFAHVHHPLPQYSGYHVVEVTVEQERLALLLLEDADKLPEEQLLLLHVQCGNDVFASGRCYAALEDANKSWRDARQALRYGIFLEENGWVRFEDTAGDEPVRSELSEWEEAFVFSLRACDRSGLEQVQKRLEDWAATARLTPEQTEQEIMKLVFLGGDVLRESGEDVSRLLPSTRTIYRELGVLDTRERMFDWCRRMIMRLAEGMEELRSPCKHNAVQKSLAYIEQHYGESLSLQQVADYVGMNANYFSLLFKEQMNISYIKYVTRVRMEHARRLLQAGLKVNEAGEQVGYYNHRHFNEVFKKTFGLTPGQYRDQSSASLRSDFREQS